MSNVKLFFLVFLLSLFVPTNGFTASATLAWEPTSEPSVIGYNIYCGTNSRVYNIRIPVPTNQLQIDSEGFVSARITNLTSEIRYYFSVTAENNIGLESGHSDELAITFPSTIITPYAINNTNIFVYAGRSTNVTISGYDSYTNVHAFKLLSQPTKGELSSTNKFGDWLCSPRPQLVYKASSNVFGYDKFKYSAWNGQKFSDPADISVIIISSNVVSLDSSWSIVGTNYGIYTNDVYWVETNSLGQVTVYNVGDIINYTNIIRNLDYLVVGWEPSTGTLEYNTNLLYDIWNVYPSTNNPVYLNPNEFPQCFFRIIK